MKTSKDDPKDDPLAKLFNEIPDEVRDPEREERALRRFQEFIRQEEAKRKKNQGSRSRHDRQADGSKSGKNTR